MSDAREPNTITSDTIILTDNSGMRHSFQPKQFAGGVYAGNVIYVSAASHTALVLLGDLGREVSCPVDSSGGGTLDGQASNMPVEGQKVLVHLATNNSTQGTILAYIPSIAGYTSTQSFEAPNRPALDYESGLQTSTELPYTQDRTRVGKGGIQDSTPGRMQDQLPGEHVLNNEQGLCFAFLTYLISMKGSENASVTVSAIDDLVRIISGYYRHISAAGDDQIYNDGGFISRVSTFALHQCERLGSSDYGESVFKVNDDPTSAQIGFQFSSEPLMPKSRILTATGFLGTIFNAFVSKPAADATQADQGLLHVNVAEDGHLGVRSAGGISLQRTDRIAIPRKLKEAWDPEGTTLETVALTPEAIPPVTDFELPLTHWLGRSVYMPDIENWRAACAYRGFKVCSKDWLVPEFSKLAIPDDSVDAIIGTATDMTSYADANSAFHLEPDGSIILRDAWGSEIVMRGGNIIITCAGEIQMRSGRNTVVVAGNDFIAKARDSVDITATRHDLRLKAEKNLQVVSNGGVLLESLAKGNAYDYSGDGEAITSSGIMIQANKSRVMTSSLLVHTHGINIVNETFGIEDKRDNGTFTVSAGVVTLAARQGINFNVGEESFAAIYKNMFVIGARNVYLAGGKGGVQAYHDNKALSFAGEAEIKSNPYTELLKSNNETQASSNGSTFFTIQQLKEIAWLGDYAPSKLTDVGFSYRTTEQYGTDKPSEVDPSLEGGKFTMYQATWASQLSKGLNPLIKGSSSQWTEPAIDSTYPWPGELAYGISNPSYYFITDYINVDKSNSAVSVDKPVVANGSLKAGTTFDNYAETLA